MLLQLTKTSRFIFVLILLCFISKGFSQNKATIDGLENRYLTFNLSISEEMIAAWLEPRPGKREHIGEMRIVAIVGLMI